MENQKEICYSPLVYNSKLKTLKIDNCRFLQMNLADINASVTDDISINNSVVVSDVESNFILIDQDYMSSLFPLLVYFDIKLTPFITGDLSYLIDTKQNIYLNGTCVNRYTDRNNLVCKHITWINCQEGYIPTEFDLNRLIADLYSSATNNGTLTINTNNPPIVDTTTLQHITDLRARGWVINHNIGVKLTVQNGTGGGYYKDGDIVNIQANPEIGTHYFIKWIGDVSTVNNVNSMTTTITIGSSNLTINATYII